MPERRLPRRAPRYRRHVDVARALLIVVHVALFFEHAKLRPDGGIAGIAGQPRHHLAGRRAAEPVEDVHDLAFASGERRGLERFPHVPSMLFL